MQSIFQKELGAVEEYFEVASQLTGHSCLGSRNVSLLRNVTF
uniref:Uncharacterized protein n=1 Tax=Anguilla anguilla TaxID=7936 RepID=A0A0E9WTF9_ANGAN